ncbi:MAG: LysE/ArgO family amino acid transporter [Pseudomonadota bacterium]
MLSALVSGFLLSLGLILAIGAQNAFVLRQGLLVRHVFVVCLICGLSDAALIAAGVIGFAAIHETMPLIEPALRYGGAAFLFVYGLLRFRSALKNDGALLSASGGSAPLLPTAVTCLALTWLNPHVYLDTVVLLGSISTQYEGQRAIFAIGAMTASFVFFFSLGYGARLLRPLFATPSAWRILDFVIAAVMWTISASLVLGR